MSRPFVTRSRFPLMTSSARVWSSTLAVAFLVALAVGATSAQRWAVPRPRATRRRARRGAIRTCRVSGRTTTT